MPETAPLDVNETTVGYELDSITLRNIASVRYVRHHEWLDHLLDNPIATSDIIPPQLGETFDISAIEKRIQEAEKEIAELEAEESAGWNLYIDNKKSLALIDATRRLKTDFGSDCTEECRKEIEEKLGLQIVPVSTMNSVKINYDRKAVDLANAQRAKQQKQQPPSAANEAGANQAENEAQESHSSDDAGSSNDADDPMDVENYI